MRVVCCLFFVACGLLCVGCRFVGWLFVVCGLLIGFERCALSVVRCLLWTVC